MLNRQQISETEIQFEDFDTVSCPTKVGSFVEVPMNCWGSVVKRYQVSGATRQNGMIIFRAEAV